MQRDISDEVANCFDAVEDEYRDQVKDLTRMWKNANWEWDAITYEVVDLEKQLYDKEQALLANQGKCRKLVQQAFDVKNEETPHLVEDALKKEIAKLKQEVTPNTCSMGQCKPKWTQPYQM
jgi:dGTP triphosphohydrolase